MNSDTEPFNRLSSDQQQVAIDLAIASSVIVTRLPSVSQEVFKLITADFAAQYDVPTSIAKYALRAASQALFDSQWSCTITKDAENVLATHFRPEQASFPGGNGE